MTTNPVFTPLRLACCSLLFLLCGITLAAPAPHNRNLCQYHASLRGGIHPNNIRQCQRLFTRLSHKKRCQFNGVFLNQSCKNALIKQPVCQQTNALLNAIPWASIKTLSAKSYGNLTLIRATAVADGVTSYAIINPQGCLVNANIDPRTLSHQVDKIDPQQSFIVLPEKPRYTRYRNQQQVMSFRLKINAPCLACQTVGTATVRFYFAQNGALTGAALRHFSKNRQWHSPQ
jgi:hypothetical protein